MLYQLFFFLGFIDGITFRWEILLLSVKYRVNNFKTGEAQCTQNNGLKKNKCIHEGGVLPRPGPVTLTGNFVLW